MRVLVYAHQLEIGGTQTNAIELAAALRDLHGCEVALFATPGPMLSLVNSMGLRYLPAPAPGFYPSPARIQALRAAARELRPDVIHVWDWWQCLDAYYGVHLPMGLPLVVTDMNMTLTRVLPKRLPTTFGVPCLVEQAKATGRSCVDLLLPPVDTNANAPDEKLGREFRALHGIGQEELLLVTVSRLSYNMKSESIARTIEAVRQLGTRHPIRFVLAGEGQARAAIEKLAGDVNAELGRPAVVLTGPLMDPRSAYAAADVVIGMGGSGLRGMAFAKPVIVVGEGAFSNVLGPATAQWFLRNGIYGQRSDTAQSRPLAGLIKELVSSPELRSYLGGFARNFVVTNFSLEVLAERLIAFMKRAVAAGGPGAATWLDGIRTAAVYARERRFLTAIRMEPPGQNAPPSAVDALRSKV